MVKDILDAIAKQRDARHWTDYQMSVRSDIPQPVISNWFSKNQIPTLPNLDKICKAFGISMSQLFAECGEPVCLTPEQRELLDHWSYLEERQKKALLQVIKEMK